MRDALLIIAYRQELVPLDSEFRVEPGTGLDWMFKSSRNVYEWSLLSQIDDIERVGR